MSAPLRKMVPQIRDLGTKFISARNFRSTRHVRPKEVPEQGYNELYEYGKYFLAGNLVGLGVIAWTQYAVHGRIINILGIPISKTV